MASAGPPSVGVRVDFDALPDPVREWVDEQLGGHVVEARTQPQGFSPGVAARLRASTGERAFVKAVSGAANPDSPGLHRAEARALAALPTRVPAPRLRAVYDDGTWVALLLDDAPGEHPRLPWRSDELKAVIQAADELCERLTPAPPGFPTVQEYFEDQFRGWRTLAENEPAGLDAWDRRHLGRLVELEKEWPAATAGETLLHCDVRADNVLIDGERVWFVDWPHAAVGAAFFDIACFAPSVTMQGGPLPEDVLALSRSGRAVPRDQLLAAVVAAFGYFVERSSRPSPPGIPTVREFQAAQGQVARGWVQRLAGWRE